VVAGDNGLSARQPRVIEADDPLHEECCHASSFISRRKPLPTLDLIGGSRRRWSIDLVYVTASTILVVGFACAIMAHWVR